MVCHCRIKEQILMIQWVVSLWSACMGVGYQRQILAEKENKLSQMLYCSVLNVVVDICASVCVWGPGDNLVFLSAVFYFLGVFCCCLVLFLRQVCFFFFTSFFLRQGFSLSWNSPNSIWVGRLRKFRNVPACLALPCVVVIPAGALFLCVDSEA